MAPKYKRSRLWVDPPFQFRLLLRVALYLLVYIAVVWHLGFFVELMVSLVTSDLRDGVGTLYIDFFLKQRPLLVGLALTAPMVLYDLLKFSHRVAGPLYRCRNLMQEMADGKPVPEFKPREHDLMKELFAAFNALIKTCNARLGAAENGRAAPVSVPEKPAQEIPPTVANAAPEPQPLTR